MSDSVEEKRRNARAKLDGPMQSQLAWAVFLVSAFGILFVAWLAMQGDKDTVNKREVFAALIPLFGTWVGTILAFYFTRANFESANASLRDVVDKLTPEQKHLQSSARQAMKPMRDIKAVTLTEAQKDADITIAQIRAILDMGNTRVPIFTAGGVAKYVIHESTLNKFIVAKALEGADAGTAPAAPAALDFKTLKLADLLAFKLKEVGLKDVVTKFAAQKTDSTLADVRDAMAAVKGAQDVFLTKTGKTDEAVEGWITNSDIALDAKL